MKQQDVIDNWKVIKALKKGKDIEYFDNETDMWKMTANVYNIEVVKYRVKPKSKKSVNNNEHYILLADEAKLAIKAGVEVHRRINNSWYVTTIPELELNGDKDPLRISPEFFDIWPKHYEYVKAWIRNSRSVQTKFRDEIQWFFVDGIPEYLPEIELRYTPEPLYSHVKTKYVPFTFETMKEHIGKPVINTTIQTIRLIIEVKKDGVSVGNYFQSYELLLKNFTFLDGTPCGVIEKP